MTEDSHTPIEPPFDKNMEDDGFDAFKDKWFGELIVFMKKQFISSIIGFEGDGSAEFYSEPQWILYFSCIVFNAIVLMNLLLALVGTVHGDIMGLEKEHRYK